MKRIRTRQEYDKFNEFRRLQRLLPGVKERDSRYRRKYREKYPIKDWLKRIKQRAIKKNIAFNIEEADIKIPETCPILGTAFVKGTPYAASIDRIDPSKGYVKGNIQVISTKANAMKQDATREELVRFSKWVNQSIL